MPTETYKGQIFKIYSISNIFMNHLKNAVYFIFSNLKIANVINTLIFMATCIKYYTNIKNYSHIKSY